MGTEETLTHSKEATTILLKYLNGKKLEAERSIRSLLQDSRRELTVAGNRRVAVWLNKTT